MNLYERYLKSKKESKEEQSTVISELITTYPKLIDYLYNRIDTCFGEHTVYIIHVKVNGIDMLKIGYTKNTVEGRFAETRYSGRNKIEIIEKIRDNKLQAKGAVDFEKIIKHKFSNFIIKTDLTLPGKNEFMDIKHKKEIISIYDTEYKNYTNVIGLKSPN
jgi:hypothetical protein